MTEEQFLSHQAIEYLEKHLKSIDHHQDLLNLINRFYIKKMNVEHVPMIINVYSKEMTDLILEYKQ